jgi:hypothetical protein
MHVVDPMPGQSAVLGVAQHVEVNVAAAGVGVARFDQALDQFDHLGDVAGGPRLGGRRQHAEGVVGGRERPLVGRGPFPPGPIGGSRLVEDLVVDVGDVADEGDVAAPRAEPAAQDVERDPATHVADVRQSLHGGAAQINGDVPEPHRHELTHGTRRRVV